MARGLVYFVLVAVLSSPMFSQSGNKPPAFEVADIHPSPPSAGIRSLKGPYIAGGLFELQSATLLDMIRLAYGPATAGQLDSNFRRVDQLDADKVVGGPNGLDFNRFDVRAKAPPHSSLASMKVMLQTLLASRFKLAVHNDSVPLPAYALTAGKKPLLKEADGSEEPGCKQPGPSSQGPAVMVSYVCRNITMAAFADAVRDMRFANLNNKRVVDQTGLKGSWNFDLKYSLPAPLSGTAPADIVTLADAVQKQLGLDLVMTKVPTPVLVVDRASDSPTANLPGLARALPQLPEEFEVADVKLTAPEFSATTPFRGGRIEVQPSGRVVIQNATLRRLIVFAWGLPSLGSDQILFGPKFMDTTRFDILAKAPLFGPPPDEPVTVPDIAGSLPSFLQYQYTNPDSIDPMLRTLLVKRFGLTFHYEDRPLPSLTLISTKPKLQKANPAHRTGCLVAPGPAGTAIPMIVMTCENITMAQFAANLPQYLPGTFFNSTVPNKVVDGTGLSGAWDFTLTFSRVTGAGANPFAGEAANGSGLENNDPSGPNLPEAMGKQLGLKLQLTKRPGKVMVIDHLEEKPKEQ